MDPAEEIKCNEVREAIAKSKSGSASTVPLA